MNTKKSPVSKAAHADYSAESVLNELEEMLDFEIRKSLVEADAGEFATEAEVKAVFQKWKIKNDI
jgi:predicted transcriptional regulator